MNETTQPDLPQKPMPPAAKLALKATDALLEGAAGVLLPGVGPTSYKLIRSLVQQAFSAREKNCQEAGRAYETELKRDVDGERRAQVVLEHAETSVEDQAKLTTCMRLFRESAYHPDATVRKALGTCAARILKEVTESDVAVEASDALSQLTALDLECLSLLWAWQVQGVSADTTTGGKLLPMRCNPGMGSASIEALRAALRQIHPQLADERVTSSRRRIERLGLITTVTEGGSPRKPEAVQLGPHRLALAENFSPPARTRLEITDVGGAVVKLTAPPTVLARELESEKEAEAHEPETW